MRRCLVATAVAAAVLTGTRPTGQVAGPVPAIDRRAVVSRHQPVIGGFDVESPLSVGNGNFAFTADATGLQSFPEAFEQTIPLGTLSNWGWHTSPNPSGWSMETFHHNEFDSHGRKVGYADIPGNRRTPEIEWLRANPHRLHLGRIGFRLTGADGARARPADLSNIEQTLDLWNGVIVSRFRFDGETAVVRTLCHPSRDLVAVRVVSALAGDGRLAVEIRFPYGTGQTVTADWTRPDAHRTVVSRPRAGAARFSRTLDHDTYRVDARWVPAPSSLVEGGSHTYAIEPVPGSAVVEFVAEFVRGDAQATASGGLPSYAEVAEEAASHWRRFWTTGGAIDLSASEDPRWRELERRIVLSRYLTAIQSAGSLPPQETGLTYNSWEGKFHLEMHWWHAVQFAAWGRMDLLERSLDYYARILPRARATAARQGYSGARWPKMTDPLGMESPSSVGPFLIWQQPHPIYYAELAYRRHGDRATLDRFATIVAETAEFMASFAAWDDAQRRYVLGPPLQCAQEVFPKERTSNCTFELTYWQWGLRTAQQWRARLGLPPEPRWARVLDGLATPAVSDGKYLFANSQPDSYTDARWARDHPMVLASLGMIAGQAVDRDTMRRTFDWIWANWSWPDTWGWDYPLVAMSAARLGRADLAVDALLLDTPKNRYRANGHNHQRPGLTIYLPGNGGLLAAVAMMAAGWDGAPNRHAPGFPDDGRWVVRWEGLQRLP